MLKPFTFNNNVFLFYFSIVQTETNIRVNLITIKSPAKIIFPLKIHAAVEDIFLCIIRLI